MKAIVDPFTLAMYCGECGAPAVDFVHAQECCAPDEPPARGALLACAFALVASVVFLLTLPLWT